MSLRGWSQPAAATQADAEAKADGDTAQLADMPAGRKSVRLQSLNNIDGNILLDYSGDWPGFLSSNWPITTTTMKTWCDFYFSRINTNGETVDYIVLDEESNFNWNTMVGGMSEANRETHYDSLSGSAPDYATIPQQIKDVATAGGTFGAYFRTSGSSTDLEGPRNLWDQFAHYKRAKAYREMWKSAESILGKRVKCSNYRDLFVTRTIYGTDGWPLKTGGVSGISSPVLYLHESAARYQGRALAEGWNHFIEVINHLRACCDSRHPVIPWISDAFYNAGQNIRTEKPWLWEQLMNHMIRMPEVKAAYVFNGGAPNEESDHHAVSYLASIQNTTKNPSYDALAFDVASVTTGDFTTHYLDYEDVYLQSGL